MFPFDSQSASANLANAKPTSTRYVFTPKPEHVGQFVHLRVMPHDSTGRPGMPFQLFTTVNPAETSGDDNDAAAPFPGQIVECKHSIVHAPKQDIHQAWYASFLFVVLEKLLDA